MALPKTIEDREYQAFKECNGNPSKRVSICQEDGDTIKVEFAKSGFCEILYNDVSAVALNTDTIVNTYTVPVGKVYVLSKCEVSGDNVSLFNVKINSNIKMKKRIWWNHWNETFDFNGLEVSAGDTIEIIVNNNSATSMVGNYEANIMGELKNA